MKLFYSSQVQHAITHFYSITGQKKLGKVICPDPWKAGARNTTGQNISNFFKLFSYAIKICLL